MNRRRRNSLIGLAFAITLVAADLSSGLGPLDFPWLPDEGLDGHVQQVEDAWGGAGTQVLFADDFTTYTAQWQAKNGLVDVHGGARAEARDGPDRWSKDLYLWGTFATPPSPAAWAPEDGAYQFGSDDGYAAATRAELVSPVIDLRALPKPLDGVSLSANEDPIQNPLMPCPIPPQGLGPGPIYDALCQVRSEYNNLTADSFGDDGRHSQPGPRPARAALVLRHAYDLRQNADGNVDGGRVVASALDEARDSWTPWRALLPTDSVLQLGGQQLRVRSNATAVPTEASARTSGTDLPEPSAQLGPTGTGRDYDPLPPHLYQGPVAAGGWHGFGGSSDGPTTSLFDLSAFAGHLVRIGFETASAPTLTKTPVVPGHSGWSLDQVEVLAEGSGAIQVLGMLEPGDGAAIAPGKPIRPSIVLQNTGREPVDVVVDGLLDEARSSQQGRLSVGPLGRIAVQNLGHLNPSTADGLHTFEATVRPATLVPGAQTPATGVATARFHFASADHHDWRVLGVEFRPLLELKGKVIEGDGRYLDRGQPAAVHLRLENRGTQEVELEVGSYRPGQASDHGDVRVVLVDEAGEEHGRLVPKVSHVELPVSRFTAGSHGTAAAARTVTWDWAGSDLARALRLQVRVPEPGSPGRELVLLDGGEVTVETIPAPPLDVDFRDPWRLDLGGQPCRRVPTDGEQRGLVDCPAQATVRSPSTRLLEIDLLRGNQTQLAITHRGASLTAVLEASADPAGLDLPAANAMWSPLATLQVPAATHWRTDRLPLAGIDRAFAGHLRLNLSSTQPFALDQAAVYLDLSNSQGLHVKRPLVFDAFDITMEPSQARISATQSSGLMWLTGIDDTTGQTRFLEDSILQPNGTVTLPARPVISWRQWLDTGIHGYGVLEVDDGAGWAPLARFAGTETALETRPIELSLQPYAGGTVAFRFRLHHEPTILSAQVAGSPVTAQGTAGLIPGRTTTPSADGIPGGWLIEGLRVHGWDAQGPVAVHEAAPGYDDYSVLGGRWAGQAVDFGIPNCWSSNGLDPTCRTSRGVSSLVTGDLSVAHMLHPVLELQHAGDLHGTYCAGGTSFPALDIEYQLLEEGLPSGPWQAGTPTEGYSPLNGGPAEVIGWRRLVGGLPQPETATLRDAPFGGIHPTDAGSGNWLGRNGCVATSSPIQALAGPLSFEQQTDLFDLTTLKTHPEGARLRLTNWVEWVRGPTSGRVLQAFGDYDVLAVRVAEHRQLIDVATTAITTAQDDADRLRRLDPSAATDGNLSDAIVLANDLAEFEVTVENVGQSHVAADVTLRAIGPGGHAVDIRWMRPSGGNFIPSQTATGSVTLPPSGPALDGGAPNRARLVFRANFLEAPPGTYRVTASSDATSGVDTAAANDRFEATVVVLPFRSLTIQGHGAAVEPYAAGPATLRQVKATIANDGNIDEAAVHVTADLVRKVGLQEFEPLGIVLEPIGPSMLQLERRGAGKQTVTWPLGPAELGDGELVKPGNSYAVRIRVEPGPSSVSAWWQGPLAPPLAEGRAPGQLLNLTAPPNPACGCLLIPFLLESVVYETDLSPTNSTTLLPALLPTNSADGLAAGWSSTTFLDGAPLSPGMRADLPRWELKPPGYGSPFSAGSTGPDWVLPSYAGSEALSHELVTPILPAHVIADTARSVLALPYASDLQAGQAVLETRSLVGGEWTPWQPADATRARRVAIILAQDFPIVEPRLDPVQLDLADLVLSGEGHNTLHGGAKNGAFRFGGPSRFCYVDADRDSRFSSADSAFVAASCTQVAAGDVRLTGALFGTAVQPGQPDAGQPLVPAGGFGWIDCNWTDFNNRSRLSVQDCMLADMDGSGDVSDNDVVLTSFAGYASGSNVVDVQAGQLISGNNRLKGLTFVANGGVGVARAAFEDLDGNGVYGPADRLAFLDPDYDRARMYEQGALGNSGAGGPPTDTSDPRVSTARRGQDNPLGPLDNATSCQQGNGLCSWAPKAHYVQADNDAWKAALDETLARLSTELGRDNVALFTSVAPGAPFGIGSWEGNDLVHVVPTEVGPQRFVIRDLNALGLELDRFGALLLVGNGLTGPFESDSATAHILEWDSLDEPDEAATRHRARTFAVLGAAHAAGINVIGTLGPAAATLATSGAVGQPVLALWQTDDIMPDFLDPARRAGTADHPGMFCLAVKPDGASSRRWEPAPAGRQIPLEPCRSPKGLQVGGAPDPRDPHNYYWVSPEDWQSFVLRDWVSNAASTPLAMDQCQFGHPLVRITETCTRFAGTTRYHVPGGPLLVSAAQPSDVAAWADDLLGGILTDGQLPAGDWRQLPAHLAFPFGGSFRRLSDGSDYFDGAPSQARIVVHANPAINGHGAMAVDGVGLLGTNRSGGLAVGFVEPRHGEAYIPGDRFDVQVQVTNRGVAAMPATQVLVEMTRFVRPGDCEVAAPPALVVPVQALAGGQQATISVPVNGGFFPSSQSCPPAPFQQNLYNLTATLEGNPADGDGFDDAATITVLGQERVELDGAITSFTVAPAAVIEGDGQSVEVTAALRNLGSGTQGISMRVMLLPARPSPCLKATDGTGIKDVFACHEPGIITDAIELPQSSAVTTLARGEAGVARLRLQPDQLDLAPGVYRLVATWSSTDSAQREHVYPAPNEPALSRWLRILPADDPAHARALLPPDGAYAFVTEDFEGVLDSHLVQVPPGPLHISGNGANDGRYAPDTHTMGVLSPGDADDDRVPLAHGWRVGSCDCADSTRSYLEWTRHGSPSFREGIDPMVDESPTGTGHLDNGHLDFGTDQMTWQPVALARSTVDAPPYLSLAGYESPSLSFLTQMEATPNTAFVVSLELARRTPCTTGGNGAVDCTGSTWEWPGRFLDLVPTGLDGSSPDYGLGDDGSPTHNETRALAGQVPREVAVRNTPSNPLAESNGFWGHTTGLHAEDQGWVRITIPLDPTDPVLDAYCRQVAAGDGTPAQGETFRPRDTDPCRHAHVTANGEDNGLDRYVARPMRIHLRAASYGGDVGSSTWRVADLSVGDHRVAFAGGPQQSVQMLDSDVRLIPVRLVNQGAATDTYEVGWQPTRTRTPKLGTGGAIDVALDPTLADAAPSLQVTLAPGASKVVWVRLHTGILDGLQPGASQRIPFLLQARSVLDPTVVAELLVDASYTGRAWPNLEARQLVLGNDAGNGLYQVPVESHLKATARFRNTGRLPLDVDDVPLRATLVIEEIDPQTGHPVPGTAATLAEATYGSTVPPYSADARDHFISFKEWKPARQGLFAISARINSGTDALPESDLGDNSWTRLVQVGPVRFADLNVTSLFATAFHGACGTQPVQRLVDGHQYCLAATIENRGLAEALQPRVDFSIGANGPFSAGAPALDELVNGTFPAASIGDQPSVLVKSSPRLIRATTGATDIVLRAELSARSVMPNFDGKVVEIRLPIEVLDVSALAPADPIPLGPSRQVLVPVLITNRGTGPATPVLLPTALIGDLSVSLANSRTLLPGETVNATLVLEAGPGLRQNASLGALAVGLVENPLARARLNVRLNVTADTLPQALALPFDPHTGTNLTLVLDAADAPLGYTWSVRDPPAGLALPDGWTFTTRPFERRIVEIPATVLPLLHPGQHALPIVLQAQAGASALLVNATLHVEVPVSPELQVALETAQRAALAGSPATFRLLLENTGNVDLHAAISHAIDHGQVDPASSLVLRAGDRIDLPFSASPAAFERSVGTTTIAWTTMGGPSGGAALNWSVHAIPARLRIAEPPMPIETPAGRETALDVVVHNEGDSTMAAEVLLAVDGVVQDARTLQLAAGETRKVSLTFVAGSPGVQAATVLVRPAGADARLGDAILLDIGDVATTKVTSNAEAANGIPGLAMAWLAMALGVIAVLRRRRR